MSKAKHTPGPWRMGRKGNECRIYADPDQHAIARTYGPSLNGIGVCELTVPENKADARRIVACVNACEGFSIEELEDANLFQDSIESGNLMYELLEALKQCRLALEPYDDVKPRDWKTDREKLAFAHQAACAAIAKATAQQ